MFLQALTAEGMKASYGLGFGVSIQTDRTSNLFFKVFEERIHRNNLPRKLEFGMGPGVRNLIEAKYEGEAAKQTLLVLLFHHKSRDATHFLFP